MKHKVSELEGALLDAAVAKAEGIGGELFEPSTNWDQGGPIIEREMMSVFPRISNLFEPIDWAGVKHVHPCADGERFRYFEQHGPTPLIAAMRAYLASKVGDEIDLP